MGNHRSKRDSRHSSESSDSFLKALEAPKETRNPVFGLDEAMLGADEAPPSPSKDVKSWIRLNATADECSSFLRDQAEGAFVIYQPPDASNKYNIAIQSSGTVRQDCLVSITKDGYQLCMPEAPEQPVFSDIADMLTYYQNPHENIPFVLLLDNPVFDRESTPSSFADAALFSGTPVDLRRGVSKRTEEDLREFQPIVLANATPPNNRSSSALRPDLIPETIPEVEEKVPEFAKNVQSGVMQAAKLERQRSTEDLLDEISKIQQEKHRDSDSESEYGFHLDEIEAAASGEGASRGSSLKKKTSASSLPQDSSFGTIPEEPLPVLPPKPVQSEDNFYGTSPESKKPVIPVISVSTDLMYGSPAAEKTIVVIAPPNPVKAAASHTLNMYGSPDRKSRGSEQPQPTIPVEEDNFYGTKPVAKVDPPPARVRPPLELAVDFGFNEQDIATTSTKPELVPPRKKDPLPLPRDSLASSHLSTTPTTHDMLNVPVPPSRPSIENRTPQPASSSTNEETKDGMYEFPVVIGQREGCNPEDVFEWARGTDMLLPLGRPQPPWIHGTRISRIDTERIFAKLGGLEGTFLVRQRVTDSNQPSYALSIVVEQHVEHHIIDVQSNTYSLAGTYNIHTVQGARSLDDLIKQLGHSIKPARPVFAVCIPFVINVQFDRPEWLHGQISREEANSRLFEDEKFVDGRFLVRISNKQQHNQAVYVVSLVWRQQFHHHLVTSEKNAWFLNGVPCKSCNSLTDVIHWMMKIESNLDCILQTYVPCPPPYHLLKLFEPLPYTPMPPEPPVMRGRVSSTSLPVAAVPRLRAASGNHTNMTKPGAIITEPPAFASPQPIFTSSNPPSLGPPSAFTSHPPPLPPMPASFGPPVPQRTETDQVDDASQKLFEAAKKKNIALTSTDPFSPLLDIPDPVQYLKTVNPETNKKFENVYADANAIFYDAEVLLRPGEEAHLLPDSLAPPVLMRAKAPPPPDSSQDTNL